MQRNILLLQPPMQHPALSNPSGIRGLAAMQTLGLQATLFDAGLDFYRRFLLDPDQLRQIADQGKRQFVSEALVQAEAATGAAETHVENRQARRQRLIEEIAAAADRMQSEAFFVPSRAAADLQRLDDVLALVSAAYQPSCFSRSGFHHPGLNNADDVKDFIENSRLNPFWPYSQAALPPETDHGLPDLILILVSRAGQVVPAASLLSSWRTKYPGSVVLAAGSPSWVEVVHAASGTPRPAELSPEVVRLWEAFQTHWMNGSESSMAAGAGSADRFLLPSGLLPDFADHPLHADAMAQIIQSAMRRGTKTMVWIDPQGEFKTITRHLYMAARQDLWNHVVLPETEDQSLVEDLIEFASVNPNIVHSWCRRVPAPSRFADPLEHWPQGSARYGETVPLPGRPFWQRLQDPVYISAYRQHLGTKTLLQLRIHPANSQVYEIGQQLAYHYAKPEELPEGYLDDICRMVEAGGSVGSQWLRHNLERAFLIAYVEERGVIVGNSSLKHPRREYIEAVSSQTGLDLRAFLERGYTSVRPEYRGFGIGAKLLEGLTERAAGYKIFSIIGEDNVATQKMAIRNRTRRVASFMSRKVGKQVGLWIPEWMLPEGIDLPPQPDFSDEDATGKSPT